MSYIFPQLRKQHNPTPKANGCCVVRKGSFKVSVYHPCSTWWRLTFSKTAIPWNGGPGHSCKKEHRERPRKSGGEVYHAQNHRIIDEPTCSHWADGRISSARFGRTNTRLCSEGFQKQESPIVGMLLLLKDALEQDDLKSVFLCFSHLGVGCVSQRNPGQSHYPIPMKVLQVSTEFFSLIQV